MTCGHSFSLIVGVGKITCQPCTDVVMLPFHHGSWINRISNVCSEVAMLCASACIVLVEQLMLILQMCSMDEILSGLPFIAFGRDLLHFPPFQWFGCLSVSFLYL